MNSYDSDFLAQSLINDGFIPADTPEQADVILINTCAVRAKPEQKAYSLLGRMSAIKAAKPDTFLGVVGCLAQMKGSDLFKRFPHLDLVMGPRELGRFPEILREIRRQSGRIAVTGLGPAPPLHTPSRGYFHNQVTGYVSVMEGCNNFCSYCIVPYVRGREISRPPYEIMGEAKDLISQGIKEITLLGQNVNSYLWKGDPHRRIGFSDLLHEVSRLDGLLRLRFVTSHPKDLSDDLIACFKNLNNLCPHIHLPFQAGANRILKRMRRGYTREEYITLVQKLRAVKPEIAITSDVMVGFPGETEGDFEQTLDLIQGVRFDSLFSFKYSDRSGTAADKMDNKIDDTTKTTRLAALQAIQKGITLEKNKALEGKHVEVLVEGISRRGEQLSGRTGSHKIVNFIKYKGRIGNLVKVRIKRSFLNSLWGEAIASGLTDDQKISGSDQANSSS